jgi:flagellar motor switch protein FliN
MTNPDETGKRRKGIDRMKLFLTAWLAEAPMILAAKLGGSVELRPSAQLPQPETSATLAILLDGPYQGCFLVTADRYALQALLAGARMSDGSVDADRDRELWRNILRQIAGQAAQAFDPPRASSISVSIEDAAWTLGLPSAAYELHFGETVLLVAFTDEIEPCPSPVSHEVPGSPDEKKPGHVPSAHAASVSRAPGGIDLLLDVELEASLRFGSREMPLDEVLDLGAGDVIELDRHVSDPVDLLVGDKIVARGEVVLVNGSFGLRVLEVAEPQKCLESIRCLF